MFGHLSTVRTKPPAPGVRATWMLVLGLASPAPAITTDPGELADVARLHGGVIEHCDAAVAALDFAEIFDCGDELFEAALNAVDGAGANVGDGGRFTRAPRADLDGPGEWKQHFPARATGPNEASCAGCHVGAILGGAGDGSGPAAMNVVRDPTGSASPGLFIQRNTPHLFGGGALQRLAEEMTLALRAQRDTGIGQACAQGGAVDVLLEAKGVSFGSMRVDCGGVVDDSGVSGVDRDLLVRPFQWKGVEPSIRSFARGAEHNELGMQAVELVGDGVDGDGDGVADELSIPDMTAMAVYLATQPRPVSELELNRFRLELARLGRSDVIAELELPTLDRSQVAAIARGEATFADIGCADCHRPALPLADPTFSEPSTLAGYRDDPFPAGQPALAETVRVDLTRDVPENQFAVGRRRFDLGNLEHDRSGRAVVRLYGDLKRHDMGPGLAENVDETGHGASVWLTKELWGVGSTGPYLHDGRATTVTEAILEHGGEASAARAAFVVLADADQADVARFLESLVLYFPEVPAAPAPAPKAKPHRKQASRFGRR